MKKSKSSAQGDKIDLGGKLPQFDAFAWFAYRELAQSNLSWIRIADPAALKVDDIQYATLNQVHAYQVKWSNKDEPEPFSYTDLLNLIKDLADGWKALKITHASENKPVIVHLLSNRPLSRHDVIKDGNIRVGAFDDFYAQVWLKLKTGELIDAVWQPIAEGFKQQSGVNDVSFRSFISNLELHFNFKPHPFGISRINTLQQNEDLILFSRFLLEEVAGRNKQVQYSAETIIQALGWPNRFRTTFNHELMVDRSKYQPIHESITTLNQKLRQYQQGYIFLVGGPGSGKSTLLTEWSRNRKERVIKYYAFDFTSPSSSLNYSERGEAVNLYFDLIFQLKSSGVYIGEFILHRDIVVLRDLFARQLDKLSEEYKGSGRCTIIIIDGLDHIPREYKNVTKSFLSELLPPSSVPPGVMIILGSQTYDMDSLQVDVKIEWEKKDRNISIAPLAKKEVFAYLQASELGITLTEEDKEKVFHGSQGHPLYLSYLASKIKLAQNIQVIEDFEGVDGDINAYYKKLWLAIAIESGLVKFLGLICRIRGNIHPRFIVEWEMEEEVLLNFRRQAMHLFDQGEDGWIFFHNSFRQFLIYETALNPLLREFDRIKDIKYHKSLAGFYSASKQEEHWHGLYHLFHAEAYDEFIDQATPESFIEQLMNFRPHKEIDEDIRLGIQIGKRRKDIYIVVRYLFAASELQRRLYNLDPASFSEDFISLEKASVAKRYLRNNNHLLCSKQYAYKACRWFYGYNDKVEAKILYTLAEPEEILGDRIVLEEIHHYEEIQVTLLEWASTAALFDPLENVLQRIDNTEIVRKDNLRTPMYPVERLKGEMLSRCAGLLIELNRWDDLHVVLDKYDLTNEFQRNECFFSIQHAIESCLEIDDRAQAKVWLDLLISKFEKSRLKTLGKIYTADLIYKVTGDVNLVSEYLLGLKQPSKPEPTDLDFEGGLSEFIIRIKFNKLLNVTGKGDAITVAVPSATNRDDEIIVEFERMLCLITQILSDGLMGQQGYGNIVQRTLPAIRFYYKTVSHHDRYWYKLTRARSEYFKFLVSAVATVGLQPLSELLQKLIEEFIAYPAFWPAEVKRDILLAGLQAGFDPDTVKEQLQLLEKDMLDGHDVSGRIIECKKHVSACIQLQEYEKAEFWIRQTIQYSTGVGYRKDYQFNTWIDWLEKINAIDSGKAKERIIWFVSKLQEIKDTTEGAAYHNAADALLRATFKTNGEWGFQQMTWQLDNGLIDFIDAIEAAVQQSLDEAKDENDFLQARDIFLYLILYVAEQSSIRLFKNLLHKGYVFSKNDFLTNQIPLIIEQIKLRAVEENRGEYFQTMYEFFTELNLDVHSFNYDMPPLASLKKEERRSASELVILPDHQGLSEAEVRSSLDSFESFRELLNKEDTSSSYFKWSTVTDKIQPFLTAERLKELNPGIRRGSRSTDFYAVLCKCAVSLGDSDLAKDFADKALASSSSSGWQKHYDGGTRLIAMKAYREISVQQAIEKAFTIFCDDVLQSDYPSSYIEYLDDILPVVTESIDMVNVWVEIDGYLKRLMNRDIAPQSLPVFQEDPEATDLNTRLLFYLYQHPVRVVSVIAKKIIVLFLDRSTNLQTAVKLLAGGSHNDKDLFISLMLALQVHKKETVLLFQEEIESLLSSDSFFIYQSVTKLMTGIILTFKLPPRPKKQLSLIYSLELKDPISLTSDHLIEENGFVKNTDNPLELIKPFTNWLNILSKKTGISKVNIAYRWKTIMQEIDDAQKLTTEYEQSVRANLTQIDLGYSYPRPRTIIAERALSFLVREFCDADALSEEEMDRHLIFHDHTIDFFIDAIVQPACIPVMTEGDRSSLPKDWVLHPEQCRRLNENLGELKPGWKVIAEYSKQRSLFWGLATQIYMMNISFNKEQQEEDRYEIFGYVFNKTVESYYSVEGCPGEPHIIIINDNRFSNFDDKTHWLAFNSNLAYYLGWEPDYRSKFGWKDANGELMVESIFWSNGNMHMNPPKLHSEVGEGWLVIISEKGLAALKKINSFFKCEKRVIRKNTEDGNSMEESYDQIKSFIL